MRSMAITTNNISQFSTMQNFLVSYRFFHPLHSEPQPPELQVDSQPEGAVAALASCLLLMNECVGVAQVKSH